LLILLTWIAATGVAAHDELFIAKEKHMARLSKRCVDRRYFVGGSDARIIMGDDESALVRLWREKRGEVEPQDFSATSSSSWESRPSPSTGTGTSETLGRRSPRFNGG
jgi:hypothetical protein